MVCYEIQYTLDLYHSGIRFSYPVRTSAGRSVLSAAPEEVFFAAGFGGNYIYVDQENDLLIVLRWVPELAAVVEAVLAALKPKTDL